jgi:hypothetical protein
MGPADVKAFIDALERNGLRYLDQGAAQDIAVVDQQKGPLCSVSWVQFGHVDFGGNTIAAAQLTGSTLMKVITPDGWEYEGSLTQQFTFLPLQGD